MDRAEFVKLSVVAFGVVVLSFFVRGIGRLVLGAETAELLQVPFAIVGFGLFVYLFVRAILDFVGVWEVDRADA
jgi:hypothetical protein